jgi:hypothetical protein
MAKMPADDNNITENMDNNDGPVFSTSGNGLQIKVPYGKDNSLYAGSVEEEQIYDGNFKGGTTNLSHTLSNTKANQSQD